jgi:hypothetical protein
MPVGRSRSKRVSRPQSSRGVVEPRRPRLVRAILGAVGLYASSIAMMAVHEAGHVLHARLSGGVVERVDVPALGFSQTFYAVNPHPHLVTWGGPVWGCVVPLMALAALARGPRRLRRAAQWFAGFCLVANGAYLGVGWVDRAGDAGDLRALGTPVWVMIAFGIAASSAGMLLWHLLGVESRSWGSAQQLHAAP